MITFTATRDGELETRVDGDNVTVTVPENTPITELRATVDEVLGKHTGEIYVSPTRNVVLVATVFSSAKKRGRDEDLIVREH